MSNIKIFCDFFHQILLGYNAREVRMSRAYNTHAKVLKHCVHVKFLE